MRALPVIIGIVVILALVSLPGAATSKADLIASLPGSRYVIRPDTTDVRRFTDSDSFACCSNSTSGMNYSSIFADDGGSSPEPGPTWGPTWDTPPHAPGSPPPGSPPTPIPSLEELIASYIVKPYSDPINCCDDCTPQTWWKGTVMPTPTPVAWTYGDPRDPYTVPVPILPCIGGHCPESLPVTWYNKVAFRILSF